MVGEWLDENSDSVVHATCRWSDDKNFLLRDFVIHVQGKPVMNVTQRIGWDPVTKQIKSWVFDSEGGYGDALWSRNGNQWIIKSQVSLPDGRIATATNVLTRSGLNTARWASTERTVGGQLIPDQARPSWSASRPAPPRLGRLNRTKRLANKNNQPAGGTHDATPGASMLVGLMILNLAVPAHAYHGGGHGGFGGGGFHGGGFGGGGFRGGGFGGGGFGGVYPGGFGGYGGYGGFHGGYRGPGVQSHAVVLDASDDLVDAPHRIRQCQSVQVSMQRVDNAQRIGQQRQLVQPREHVQQF